MAFIELPGDVYLSAESIVAIVPDEDDEAKSVVTASNGRIFEVNQSPEELAMRIAALYGRKDKPMMRAVTQTV